MKLAQLRDAALNKISASFAVPSASVGKTAEQRRAPRYSNDFKINLLDQESRPADEAVRLLDMSKSGVGIESVHDLRIGQKLGFNMSFGEGQPITARARVCWRGPASYGYSYGLEFEDMDFLSRLRVDWTIKPKSFGIIEFFTLLLEAGTSIVLVLLIGDLFKSIPYFAEHALFALPIIMFVAVGGFISWLLSSSCP